MEILSLIPGTNDDEDFPASFLHDIYDRIQQQEFATGKDHTHQVAEIRKKIVGHGIPVGVVMSVLIIVLYICTD